MSSEGIKSVNKIVEKNSVDGLLVFSQENIRYLSGFAGSTGLLLISNTSNYFLTDSRYTTEARQKVSNFEIREYKDQFKEVSSLIKILGLKRLGIEVSALTHETFLKLKSKLRGCRLIPIVEDLNRLRIRKDSEELYLIKKAIKIAEKAYNEVIKNVKIGLVERDIAIELEHQMRLLGSDGYPFDIIVASSSRSAMPHAKATKEILKKGGFLVIDFGSNYNGYKSDETCTLVLGKPSKKHLELYNIVKTAHDIAISSVKPGVMARNLDKKARGYIKRAGYGEYFGHGLGHGVGLAVHEEPRIAPTSNTIIEEGNVFTIEPGIYIPGWGGVRIEDMVYVTKTGCEVLTKIPKEMKIIDT